MRQQQISVERLEAIARTALLGGYGHVETWRDNGRLRRRVKLAISMDCENPAYAELYSRFPAVHGRKRPGFGIILETRCRKCRPCKERRRVFWSARAQAEWRQSSLTLFGTLTFSPEQDARLDAVARVALAKRGVDFDRLEPADMFRARVKYYGAEVTTWLKRLRNSDRKRRLGFRYLLVAEAHNSARTSLLKRGRPHFHCLLHQTEGAALVLPLEWSRKTTLELRTDRLGNPLLDDNSFLKRQWTCGHSTFAFCRSPQAASYLTKYLTKEETAVRIRASFGYGAERSEVERGEASEDQSITSQGGSH